jgi:hypothetical protein
MERQFVDGIPVAQLPDTSDMVEIKVDASLTCVYYPEAGGGWWCDLDGEPVIQVLSPAGREEQDYVWDTFVNRNALFLGFSDSAMGYRHGNVDSLPQTARLYVAFDSPAAAGEFRSTQFHFMSSLEMFLVAKSHNPESPPASVNFRMFLTDWKPPEFWTTFVKSMEIV